MWLMSRFGPAGAFEQKVTVLKLILGAFPSKSAITTDFADVQVEDFGVAIRELPGHCF